MQYVHALLTAWPAQLLINSSRLYTQINPSNVLNKRTPRYRLSLLSQCKCNAAFLRSDYISVPERQFDFKP